VAEVAARSVVDAISIALRMILFFIVVFIGLVLLMFASKNSMV
jgi:hypothetical protein